MRYSKSILASIISISLTAAAQAQEPLSPVQVSELFFKTLIQTDAQAMAALNAYQQPVRDANHSEGPFINIEKMLETDAIYAEHLSKNVLRQVKLSDEDKVALKPQVVAMLQAIRDGQKRTVCAMGEVTPVTEGVHKGYKTVTVDFECKVINPKEKITVVLRRALADEWNSLEQYRQGFSAVTQDYQTAPLTQEFNGKFPLTSKEDVTVWQNVFPRESLNIAEALY